MSKQGTSTTLDGGLVLRTATAEDTEAIAQFNGTIHAEAPAKFDEGVAHWTRDLLSGRHPTVKPSDFTLVEDPTSRDASGRPRIISSLMLISQTWSYAGIEFGFGQPELVGTDPDYRRRGLVRVQMEAIHKLSAAKGQLLQGITGIPWYYRQFGYEMTLDLGGGRNFFWQRQENRPQKDQVALPVRAATIEDIPFMQSCYARAGAESRLFGVRDEQQWRYTLCDHHPKSVEYRSTSIVSDEGGQPIGYFRWSKWGKMLSIQEMAIDSGVSWRTVALAAAAALKQEVDEQTEDEDKKADSLRFHFGSSHPIYEALGSQLERQDDPYMWYIRVPDLTAFMNHIAPALDERLARSVMAGYSGELKLGFYTSQICLRFESGKLKSIEPYEAEQFFDGHAFYPDLTFYHLLFGHRSTEQIRTLRPDCWIKNPEMTALLNSLFPRQPSHIYVWA